MSAAKCERCGMELKYHAETCTFGGSEAEHSFAGPAGSAAEWEGYDRIRPEEAVIGDEFFGRMLTWEVIKTRFQVTGVQLQKPSCRRKQQNAPVSDAENNTKA